MSTNIITTLNESQLFVMEILIITEIPKTNIAQEIKTLEDILSFQLHFIARNRVQ